MTYVKIYNIHRITSKSQHLPQDNVQFNGTLNVGYDLSYTYGTEDGKKFQLASVKDVNYRTEETPGENNVENNHVYTYDKNGNLVYVNTGRLMNDGHNETGTGERKLIWDEENRLLAVDDNGFVSNYWYDADGECTVKTSGESDQVYVNGVFSGGSTNTAKFSLYVSPYLVANQGGRYTKHIYAGSQRIVSKIGDFASYGSDPRRIEYAGANTDGLSVDYKAKYAAQQQVIKDNYKFFDVPYNGTDNDNYADGEGFCCNDGSMEAAMAQARKAQVRAVARSFKDPDNYENLQFFYHPDHLGSSSFITNLEGEVVQHIEYVPFGEVFIEERNGVWNTPYLFNAKEFDEETGMYYYGARYYEPRLSLWMTTDPLEEEYPNIITYGFCHNNPVVLVDPDGMGDYYNKNGIWLGNDGKKDNLAYLADVVLDKDGSKHFQNATVLSLKNSELNIFANTVAQESSGDKAESFALASAIMNLAEYKGKSIMQTIQSEGIFGYRDGGNSTQYNNNAEYSMAAVLNAITGGHDFSNGAIRWDGFDLAMKGWDHVKSKNQGLGISRSHYQTFYNYWTGGNRLKNASGNKNATFNPEFKMTGKKLTYSPAVRGYWKGMVLYNSSAAYGGTIFWRPVSNFLIKGVNLNRNFRKVNGSKNKPL